MSTPPVTSVAAQRVSQAGEPAWVRKGSPQVQRSYAAALAFEQTLVEQLAKTMLAGSGLGAQGEGEASAEEGATPTDAGSGLLSSLLPQTLAGSVSANGGFGLAAELTRGVAGTSQRSASSAGEAPAAANGATGGTVS